MFFIDQQILSLQGCLKNFYYSPIHHIPYSPIRPTGLPKFKNGVPLRIFRSPQEYFHFSNKEDLKEKLVAHEIRE
jgi:hypothetical protein